jgi:nucleotide-binding universal stress UspA family protein
VDRIIVGVDGSNAGREAFGWAHALGERYGSTVLAVHATRPPDSTAWPAPPRTDLDRAHEEGWALLDDLIGDFVAEHAKLEWEVVFGDPADTLVTAARGADLLVLARDPGRSRLTIGTVTRHCITHAPCPVVVVPTAH